MTFEAYQNEMRTRRAVKRNIENIGEALNRVLNKETEIKFLIQGKLLDFGYRLTEHNLPNNAKVF